jgi:hypothetical protein
MTTSIRHMSFVRGQKARLPELTMEIPMSRFADMLRTHRFDDYRYDHQGRINETTPHLISAIFLGCYALLFEDAALAGLVGLLAMLTPQSGHFFFEPNGFDAVNNLTYDWQGSDQGRLSPDAQDRFS